VVNAVALIIGAIIAAVFAAVGLQIGNVVLVIAGIGNGQTGAFGVAAGDAATGSTLGLGLWGLLPVLFPFIIIAVILLGIWAFFRAAS
jgi:hypothetical protein